MYGSGWRSLNPMIKQSQSAGFLPAHPLWMRLAAVFSFLLMLVASSAEATHVHGDWLPHTHFGVALQANAVAWPADEANCPLCMAMHSAVPTGVQANAESLSFACCRTPSFPDPIARRMLRFSLFSRPPPDCRPV